MEAGPIASFISGCIRAWCDGHIVAGTSELVRECATDFTSPDNGNRQRRFSCGSYIFHDDFSFDTHDPTLKPTKTRPKPQSQVLAVVAAGPETNGLQRAIAEAKTQERIDGLLKHACEVTGARTDEFAHRIIIQAAGSLVSPRAKDGPDGQLVAGFAAIAEMAPRNATEAMLATQMIAVHDAALRFSTGPRKTIITMPPIEMLFGQVV